jgi:hypothetical protein
MSVTIALMLKIKKLFAAANSDVSSHIISIAPFAFPLTNTDFKFLDPSIETASGVKEYYDEECEFANIANSISKDPYIWQTDSQSLLYDIFKEILSTSKVIDISLTADEQIIFDKAKTILYNQDTSDSDKYTAYKSIEMKIKAVEDDIIGYQLQINSTEKTDIDALNKLNKNVEAKNKEKDDLLIEWAIKGNKSEIEGAKRTILNIGKDKEEFLKKWNDYKNNKLGESEVKVSSNNLPYYETTCIPNDIYDLNSNVWKKIEIEETELKKLNDESKSIPSNEISILGDDNIDLKKISFEICWLEIQRPWFDEKLLTSRFWKSADNTLISGGYDSFDGILPSYPVKLVLVRNVEFELNPISNSNEGIKKDLQDGKPMFIGPFMIKNLPVNKNRSEISTLRTTSISTNQLKIINKAVEEKNDAGIKTDKIVQPESKMMFRTGYNVKLKEQMQSSFVAKPQAKPLVQTKSNLISTIGSKIPNFVDVKGKSSIVNTNEQPPKPVEKNFKIFGIIKDSNNEPLSADVSLLNASHASLNTYMSDSSGTFSFSGLLKGNYSISVRKDSYDTYEKEIMISDKDFEINISLMNNPVPTMTFQILAVVSKKLQKLPDPISGAIYGP